MHLTKPRIIIGMGLVILLLIIVYFILTSVERSGKITLAFHSVPADASITIDSKAVSSGDKIYLPPGTYAVEAKRDGFRGVSHTIALEDIDRSLTIALMPVSDEAKKWAKEHEQDYIELEGLSEIDSLEVNKKFGELNPIVKHLPYKTFIYGIGHHTDPSDPSGNSIIIDIDAPEGYRQAALYRIRQLGYDPTDFNINFRDYENPFPL